MYELVISAVVLIDNVTIFMEIVRDGSRRHCFHGSKVCILKPCEQSTMRLWVYIPVVHTLIRKLYVYAVVVAICYL
jgi:hypothetical protein